MSPQSPISHRAPVVVSGWEGAEKDLGQKRPPETVLEDSFLSNGAHLYNWSLGGVEDKQTREEMHLISISRPDGRQANVNDETIQISKHLGGSATTEVGTFQAYQLG